MGVGNQQSEALLSLRIEQRAHTSVIEIRTAIHELIDGIRDEQFLRAVFTILEKQIYTEPDFRPQLSDEQRASIRRSIADANAGRMKPFGEVLRNYQWGITKTK